MFSLATVVHDDRLFGTCTRLVPRSTWSAARLRECARRSSTAREQRGTNPMLALPSSTTVGCGCPAAADRRGRRSNRVEPPRVRRRLHSVQEGWSPWHVRGATPMSSVSGRCAWCTSGVPSAGCPMAGRLSLPGSLVSTARRCAGGCWNKRATVTHWRLRLERSDHGLPSWNVRSRSCVPCLSAPLYRETRARALHLGGVQSFARRPRMASSAYAPYTQVERRSVPSRVNPTLVAAASIGVLSVRVSIRRRCSPLTANPYSQSVCRTSTPNPAAAERGSQGDPDVSRPVVCVDAPEQGLADQFLRLQFDNGEARCLVRRSGHGEGRMIRTWRDGPPWARVGA